MKTKTFLISEIGLLRQPIKEEGRKPKVAYLGVVGGNSVIGTDYLNLTTREINRLMEKANIPIEDNDSLRPQDVNMFRDMIGDDSAVVIEYEVRHVGDEYEYVDPTTGKISVRRVGYDYSNGAPSLKEGAKDFIANKILKVIVSKELTTMRRERVLDRIEDRWNALGDLFSSPDVFAAYNTPEDDLNDDDDDPKDDQTNDQIEDQQEKSSDAPEKPKGKRS